MAKEYISRDEMIEQAKARIVLGAPKFNTGLKAAIEVATSILAADVVEVRHGRWIKSPECPEEYDICSICGKNDKHRSRGNWEHDMIESVPPYCKWCGAKMDEEEPPKGE